MNREILTRRALVMLRCVAFIVFLTAGSLYGGHDAWCEETQPGSAIVPPSGSGESLATLITQYLAVEDRGQAESSLQAILVHPQASLERVSEVLHKSRTYEAAPVGMLPSQPVRVRDKTFSYGLFVPPAYDPNVASPLVVCLHGAGFTGDSYLERWAARLGEWSILACPTTMAGTWWTRPRGELVLATLPMPSASVAGLVRR